MSVTTCRIVLAGLGNVGGSFLQVLCSQRELLRERYGLALVVVGAAELGGAALNRGGLDIEALLAARSAGRNVATLPHVGRQGMSAVELVQAADADLLVEATPTNLRDGQPGLDIVRAAIRLGMHVVLANKGPLVLAYSELAAASARAPARLGPRLALRFSACVGGALPTINLAWRDLAGCRLRRVEGVLNGTSQSILRAMECGMTYAEALAEAQRRGMAETDPSLDVEGWDAANKLVILANAVLGRPTTLDDVAVSGITTLGAEELRAALSDGRRIVQLCLAEQCGHDYRLSVRPAALPLEHPLARMTGDEMGVVYYTDTGVCLSATSDEPGPEPTASALLRDVLEILSTPRCP